MRTKLIAVVTLVLVKTCIMGCKLETPSDFEIPETLFISGGSFDRDPSRFETEQVYQVSVSDFHIGKKEISNSQFALFLNEVNYFNTSPMIRDEKSKKRIRDNRVLNPRENMDLECCKDVFILESQKNDILRTENGFGVKEGKGQSSVTCATYFGAIAFCEWLSGKTSRNYRLPTEAEWEFACMTIGTQCEGMPGGEWEWCSDWYGRWYQTEPEKDPQGPESSQKGEIPERVTKGGKYVSKPSKSLFDSPSGNATCFSRGSRYLINGGAFRVVMEADE